MRKSAQFSVPLFILLLTPGVAAADYDSCTYDAGKRHEECLRLVSENYESDDNCNLSHDTALEVCRLLYMGSDPAPNEPVPEGNE